MIRNIVKIDETKCNGCGLCIPACAEGAIRIVDGKARLVADNLCDGLGACLGDCPRGAITLEKREAGSFDHHAVNRSVAAAPHSPQSHGGCPSSRPMALAPHGEKPDDRDKPAPSQSRLGNWPVQLSLVPPTAPFLEDADLLLAADCAPFAYADFHRNLLSGKTLLIGCPKLDDGQAYLEKMTAILRQNNVRSLTVVHMEVPCCSGLIALARQALAESGRETPFHTVSIGVKGDRK